MLDIRRILFLVIVLVVTLTVPFEIYGTNGRFDIKSILLNIEYDMSDTSTSIQFFSNLDILLPSLLVCAPCIIWFLKTKNMSPHMLLKSAGFVILVLTGILMIFLPISYVIPWLPSGIIAAVVPKFIDLAPFSGLAFSIMVLLPLIWRGFIYPKSDDFALRSKIAAGVLSVFALLAPLTIETFSWQGFDRSRSYFEGFSLDAVTWDIGYRVDGNFMGQNDWFNFTILSIYRILASVLLLLPCIIFVWFTLQSPYNRNKVKSMVIAGLVHILVVSLASIWINYTSSHPGTWVVSPFPILFVVGTIIAVVHTGYQWIQRKSTSVTGKTTEEPILS